jgi:CRP-like cAMP-binding protein
MSVVLQTPNDCRNGLLSMLPEADYKALLPHLELMVTPMHFVLFERDKPMQYAYFPLSGEHSILAIMENGASVEIGTVGYEGMSSVDLITGNDLAIETTVCQVPGESLRMSADKFKETISGDTALRRIVLRYMQAYLSQVSQSVACNALHTLEQRFARWILMTLDRMPQGQFQLTQEYLASMLGVHRPSVSVIAGKFQQNGIIDYKRGVLTVLDRQKLEQVVCECYATSKKQFQRLLSKDIS